MKNAYKSNIIRYYANPEKYVIIEATKIVSSKTPYFYYDLTTTRVRDLPRFARFV